MMNEQSENMKFALIEDYKDPDCPRQSLIDIYLNKRGHYNHLVNNGKIDEDIRNFLNSNESNLRKAEKIPITAFRKFMEVFKGERLLNEIASENNVHPNMLTRWKTEASNNLQLLFENENAKMRKQAKYEV
ncbi:MAG: hypothetical protein ACI39W_00005 [Brotaphodocola sp.]